MDKNKTNTGKKVIDSSARCITCNRACSMSGLCMKQWPEFMLQRPEGGSDDHADDEKNSKNR